MVKLIAQTPCEGQLPMTIGDVTLTEVVIQTAWNVAPFAGKEADVSKALEAQSGVGFPAANRMLTKAGSRSIWVGAGRALVQCDGLPELSGLAAVTEQGDAIAAVRLDGPAAEATLARLVPLDLRVSTFKRGHTARSFVGHMAASVTRVGAEAFEVMVMRSMARTLVHELEEAAKGLAARA